MAKSSGWALCGPRGRISFVKLAFILSARQGMLAHQHFSLIMD